MSQPNTLNPLAQPIWQITEGDSPLVATAIHAGHDVRSEIVPYLAIDNDQRLREEDPFTDRWATIAGSTIVGLRSRFEVDLNRPREKAVYLTPADAWGLKVWVDKLPPDVIERSLSQYDAFYAVTKKILSSLQERHGKFVVFDLHSYNHRRPGPDAPPEDPVQNPEVNIGTGTMNRSRWAPVVDRFITELKAYEFGGTNLDVRENVKFRGGHFSRWIHENFPETGCAIAIEFKKFFMDEWTGRPFQDAIEAIGMALQTTIPAVLAELKMLTSDNSGAE